MSTKVGGTSEVYDAKPEIQTLVNSVKDSLEEKTGKTFSEFKAVQYKSQVVAGTNFFVKVAVGDGNYYHLRIFRPLPHVNGLPELHSYQEGKAEGSEIEYF